MLFYEESGSLDNIFITHFRNS